MADIVTALSAARNAVYVPATIQSAVSAVWSNQIQTSQLLTDMKTAARKRTIYNNGVDEVDEKTVYAPSPVFMQLINAFRLVGFASGTSRVMYAPPSSGKTTALKIFMTKFLSNSKLDLDALMFSVMSQPNYYDAVLRCFSKNGVGNPEDIMKCLIAALNPGPAGKAKYSPWLIFDEFNDFGEDDVNLNFAQALFRGIASVPLRINVLFVTQNEEVASKLLSLNDWQKIAPLPGFTTPDVTSVGRAPKEFKWNIAPWTVVQLSMVCFLEYPELRKDKDNIVEKEGETIFKLLQEDLVENPTIALRIGARRMAEITEETIGMDKEIEQIYSDFAESKMVE